MPALSSQSAIALTTNERADQPMRQAPATAAQLVRRRPRGDPRRRWPRPPTAPDNGSCQRRDRGLADAAIDALVSTAADRRRRTMTCSPGLEAVGSPSDAQGRRATASRRWPEAGLRRGLVPSIEAAPEDASIRCSASSRRCFGFTGVPRYRGLAKVDRRLGKIPVALAVDPAAAASSAGEPACHEAPSGAMPFTGEGAQTDAARPPPIPATCAKSSAGSTSRKSAGTQKRLARSQSTEVAHPAIPREIHPKSDRLLA